MKYNFGRKTQLDKHFGDRFKYESVDFFVLEADSREEAEKELEDWKSDWIKRKKEELAKEAEEKANVELDEEFNKLKR